MINSRIKYNRSQQEILGFALIIIIVVVIAVIFLGIALRQKSTIEATDAEIGNFLIASSGVTTPCYLNNEPSYRSLGDLVKDCNNKDTTIICPANVTVCSYINKTYSEYLAKFRPAGMSISYYKLSFMFNGTGSKELTRVTSDLVSGTTKGCTVKRAGRNYIYPEGGVIYEQLEVCPQP